MQSRQPEFLTVRELADLLRVKDRKVYALAASGTIPCSRATGKILFPRAAIEAWLASHASSLQGQADDRRTADPPAIMAGSHDPLLDWALRESRSGIASFFDGSLDGLARMARGEAACAGMHVFEPPDDGSAEAGWNRRHVVAAMGDAPVVLLKWAWRERGLVVAPGNPLRMRQVDDLRGYRLMPRQSEAASQLLLLRLLEEAGIAPDEVTMIDPPARNETDLVQGVADGKADAALGLACAARQARLGFVPLLRERFDLLLLRRFYFEAPFQRFLAFCRGPAMARRAEELGGYDLSGFGSVHFNGP